MMKDREHITVVADQPAPDNLGVAVSAIVNYYRREPEDHDLGQFASLQEAMNKPHGHRGPRSPRR